jgi:hypothetical protein
MVWAVAEQNCVDFLPFSLHRRVMRETTIRERGQKRFHQFVTVWHFGDLFRMVDLALSTNVRYEVLSFN